MMNSEEQTIYKRLPGKKEKTTPVAIKNNTTTNDNKNDLFYGQFDPAPFSSTPPNDFIKFLKLRIKNYH